MCIEGNDPCRSIHKRSARESGKLRVRQSAFGHGPGAANHGRCACRQRSTIRPKDDVRVEDCDKRLEVAAARGSKKRIDHFLLPAEIAVRNRDRSPYASAGAARQLPGRGR